MGIGAAAGALAGGFRDVYLAEVSGEFLDDVSTALAPGKFAVIADVSEEWVTPVDVRMEGLGGIVFRSAKTSVEAEQRAREVARLRDEIEHIKIEHSKAHADRKAKLQARIDKLDAQLEAQLNQVRQRLEQSKRETDAKVEALHAKAAKAKADRKAHLDAAVERIRQGYKDFEKNMRHILAGQMRGAAARLEKEAEVVER